MDDRIEKILKTDADARKRIAQAQQRANEVTQEAENEVEKLRVQYEKKAETKLREIKKELQKKLTTFEEKKRAENAKIYETLDSVAKEKTNEWVDEIYRRVISM